jgi:undecaprenyl phosphate-alpha-L-ara4N flippase subunit ArnE
MLKLIFCSLLQCTILTAGQIFLKFALIRMGQFSLTWEFFKRLLINWQLLCSGLCMLFASLVWFYILKHYELSLAYPLISMSYVFGTLAAIFIFHETIPLMRWLGIFFIILGVIFLTSTAPSN